MKYAVACRMDQTWGYYHKDGSEITTEHSKAKLWVGLAEASAALSTCVAAHAIHLKNGGNTGIKFTDEDVVEIASSYWLEAVLNETEFRAREDTW